MTTSEALSRPLPQLTRAPSLADDPDPRRAELRAAVAEVEAALPAVNAGAGEELGRAWKRLVTLLALGPAPALRACPVCGHFGMRDATRCGHCWSSLTPPGR